ncbi:MAG: sel1 repeat family protein [Muribaculaceae bacterium]|nr:sel1 repeat family protein [Muribaculaceae bacterium]
MTVIAVIAVAFAPQAQARKKRDLKKEAIEDLLREGNAAYEAENYDDAFDYFEAAHKKGNIRATHNLAICYAQGYGVDKSLTMALKLHEKAAKKGNVDSMVELGKEAV